MSLPGAIALVAACLAAVIDWLAAARDDLRAERLVNPAVIVALIAAVLLAGPGVFPARALLVIALAASLAGDLLLLPPGRFTAGLAAFLVAHLAYLALFLLGPLDAGAALGGGGGCAPPPRRAPPLPRPSEGSPSWPRTTPPRSCSPSRSWDRPYPDWMIETPPLWQRRYRAPILGFPTWSRHAPDRLVYTSSESGVYQLHSWNLATGERRQITDEPVGLVSGHVSADGEWVIFHLDPTGSEFGTWMTAPFSGGAPGPR